MPKEASIISINDVCVCVVCECVLCVCVCVCVQAVCVVCCVCVCALCVRVCACALAVLASQLDAAKVENARLLTSANQARLDHQRQLVELQCIG